MREGRRVSWEAVAVVVVFSAAVAGCGSETEDAAVTEASALVGGSTVTSGENAAVPYSSVIKITTTESDSSLESRGLKECSGIKFRSGDSRSNPDRFLTAAHCVEGFSGGQARIKITNNVNLSDRGLVHDVVKIYVHPTWRLYRGNAAGDFYGDQFDIAMIDAYPTSGSNGIPALGTVHSAYVPTPGHIARVIGYGSGAKREGDNQTANIDGASAKWDESVANIPYLFWYGNPAAQAGDSGSPLVSTVPDWRIIGVLADTAPGNSNSAAFSRTSSVKLWLEAPQAQPTAAAGQRGRLINAAHVKCLTMFNLAAGSFATVYSCFGDPDSTGHIQYWQLTASGTSLQIRNGKTGLCLQPNSANPAQVIQQTCSSSSTSQRWQFIADTGDVPGQGLTVDGLTVYNIRNTQTQTCLVPTSLSVPDGPTFQNGRLRLQTCNDVKLNDQKWAFSR
jgi:hypothetical protein